jgi:hypothetical protein
MTTRVRLWAEREAVEPVLVAECGSLPDAARAVLQAEEDGRWPEGCDAVARAEDGRAWFYDDDWHPMETTS